MKKRICFVGIDNYPVLNPSMSQSYIGGVETVDESVFYDLVLDRDMVAPGLETVLTCYTRPGFEEADSGGEMGDGTEQQPAASDGSEEEESFGEGGLEGVLDADPAIGDLTNINTAPRAVLEGMFPSYELSQAMVEDLVRWRNEVDEEALRAEDEQDVDQEAQDLQDAMFGVDQDQPKQFFTSLEDLGRVPGFEADTTSEETQALLQENFGVESDVFTVYLWARVRRDDGWEPEGYYETPPGQSLRLRAIVWRVNAATGPKIVYLRPWHEVPYQRWRIPDFQRELPAFRKPEYR